jgi:ABC-type antimicrobial peptide transport system permease subunit
MTIYVRTAGADVDRGALDPDDAEGRCDGSGFRASNAGGADRALLAQERFFASLGTTLGAAALLLACIGLYGLLSYAVTRRTPELGVRLALGASPGRLASSVIRESLLLAAAGAALGVPAAYALGRAAESSLFGVSATSPVLLAAASIVLAAVSAGAAFIPARRASRVDPLVALRAE